MGNTAPSPTLLIVVGPPAVGKMTVGEVIAGRTGFKLFHNHMSIEPVLRYFDFGHPSFIRLVEGFRHAVLEEVAQSELPGLVFTYAWAFGHPGEAENVESYAAHFRSRGGRVLFLELNAPLEIRLERNRHPRRSSEKPSKRDIDRSTAVLLDHEETYQFSSMGSMSHRDDWLCIENSDLDPDTVAKMAIEHFRIPTESDARRPEDA